jgi:glutamate racemase
MPVPAVPPLPSLPRPSRVGVFDSGVGGLSVLRALAAALPQAHFVYLADSGHAPYGERSDAHVLERSHRITRHLLDTMHCQGVVIACNTATAVAIAQLREAWPGVPLVGVEPGVKPAVAQSAHQRIGVMATTSTLRHPRFHALVQAHAATAAVIAQPCPGLALAIEQGDLQAPEVLRLLVQYCGQLRDKQVDTVVLGCTHYAFVHDQIKALLGPGVRLIDTAEAVAQQAARRFEAMARPCDAQATPFIELQTTGEEAQLHDIALRWLGLDLPAVKVQV